MKNCYSEMHQFESDDPLFGERSTFLTYSSSILSFSVKRRIVLYFKTISILSDDLDSQPLRQKRLGHDLRGLLSDASEGIRAKPLDSSYYHWQASITGIII